MLGYLKNPEATSATFDDDGWFHAGDIAYYDEDGYLYVIDRIKDLIKYKSYQVNSNYFKINILDIIFFT